MIDKDKYVQEVFEKFKTMPIMEPIEMKPKFSILDKIVTFLEKLFRKKS